VNGVRSVKGDKAARTQSKREIEGYLAQTAHLALHPSREIGNYEMQTNVKTEQKMVY
jgi:hypothetical protein